MTKPVSGGVGKGTTTGCEVTGGTGPGVVENRPDDPKGTESRNERRPNNDYDGFRGSKGRRRTGEDDQRV